MKHKVLLSTILVMIILTIAVAPALADTATYGIVNTTTLNVRSGPGINYSIVGTLSYGTDVWVHLDTKTYDPASGKDFVQLQQPYYGKWVALMYLALQG